MKLWDECYPPALLFAALFFPLIGGVASGIAAPYALWSKRSWASMAFVAAMAVDYLVPLKTKPWTGYLNIWVSMLTKSLHAYFPGGVNVVVDPELKIQSERKYLICAHPHGIFGFYIIPLMDYFTNMGVQMTCFAAPVLTRIPFARRHFSWMGITCADAKTMRDCMRKYHVCYSTPGGVEEMFCVPEEQIVVMKRKGFCKIALQSGTDLIPVYGFGNNQMFPVQGGQGSLLARVSKKLNVTLALWLGRAGIPYSCFPVKHPQLVAVGAPIPVEKKESPSQDDIDELHRKYCSAIRQLFDKHKVDPQLASTGFGSKQLYFEDEGKSK